MTTFAIPSVNLMPGLRLAAVVRRRRLRLWIGVGVAYVTGCAGVWAAFAAGSPDSSAAAAKIVEVQGRIATSRAEFTQTMTAQKALKVEIDAAREVQEHPDWSVLLRLIARAAGPDVVLSSCDLRPLVSVPVVAKAAPGKKSPPKAPESKIPDTYTLKIVGIAASQNDVPRFDSALEGLRVFQSVDIVSIRAREMVKVQGKDGKEWVSPQLFNFELSCVLSDDGAAMKPSTQEGGK